MDGTMTETRAPINGRISIVSAEWAFARAIREETDRKHAARIRVLLDQADLGRIQRRAVALMRQEADQ
jgi:hypothetical protein